MLGTLGNLVLTSYLLPINRLFKLQWYPSTWPLCNMSCWDVKKVFWVCWQRTYIPLQYMCILVLEEFPDIPMYECGGKYLSRIDFYTGSPPFFIPCNRMSPSPSPQYNPSLYNTSIKIGDIYKTIFNLLFFFFPKIIFSLRISHGNGGIMNPNQRLLVYALFVWVWGWKRD